MATPFTRTVLAAAVLAASVSVTSDALAQVARPATAGVTTSRMTAGAGARQVAAGGSVSGLQRAMSAFAADMGRMPTGAEGLEALIKRPPGAKNWRGPYIATNNFRATFADPWGNMYRYTAVPAGRTYIYTIASNGPDGVPNTKDDLQVQF